MSTKVGKDLGELFTSLPALVSQITGVPIRAVPIEVFPGDAAILSATRVRIEVGETRVAGPCGELLRDAALRKDSPGESAPYELQDVLKARRIYSAVARLLQAQILSQMDRSGGRPVSTGGRALGEAFSAWVASRHVDRLILAIDPAWDGALIGPGPLQLRGSVLAPCIQEIFSSVAGAAGTSMDEVERVALGAGDGDAIISRMAALVAQRKDLPVASGVDGATVRAAVEASIRRAVEPLGRLTILTSATTPLEEGARAAGLEATRRLAAVLAALAVGPGPKVAPAIHQKLGAGKKFDLQQLVAGGLSGVALVPAGAPEEIATTKQLLFFSSKIVGELFGTRCLVSGTDVSGKLEDGHPNLRGDYRRTGPTTGEARFNRKTIVSVLDAFYNGSISGHADSSPVLGAAELSAVAGAYRTVLHEHVHGLLTGSPEVALMDWNLLFPGERVFAEGLTELAARSSLRDFLVRSGAAARDPRILDVNPLCSYPGETAAAGALIVGVAQEAGLEPGTMLRTLAAGGGSNRSMDTLAAFYAGAHGIDHASPFGKEVVLPLLREALEEELSRLDLLLPEITEVGTRASAGVHSARRVLDRWQKCIAGFAKVAKGPSPARPKPGGAPLPGGAPRKTAPDAPGLGV